MKKYVNMKFVLLFVVLLMLPLFVLSAAAEEEEPYELKDVQTVSFYAKRPLILNAGDSFIDGVGATVTFNDGYVFDFDFCYELDAYTFVYNESKNTYEYVKNPEAFVRAVVSWPFTRLQAVSRDGFSTVEDAGVGVYDFDIEMEVWSTDSEDFFDLKDKLHNTSLQLEIIENPIASIEIINQGNALKVYEDHFETAIHSEYVDEEWVSEEYRAYQIPFFDLLVHLKDGTEETLYRNSGTGLSFYRTQDGNYHTYYKDIPGYLSAVPEHAKLYQNHRHEVEYQTDQYQTPWLGGETYPVTINYFGASTTVTIEVIKNEPLAYAELTEDEYFELNKCQANVADAEAYTFSFDQLYFTPTKTGFYEIGDAYESLTIFDESGAEVLCLGTGRNQRRLFYVRAGETYRISFVFGADSWANGEPTDATAIILAHYDDSPSGIKCGEDVEWSACVNVNDETWILAFNGSGAIWNYEAKTAPWLPIAENVSRVVFGEEITAVSSAAFSDLSNVKTIRNESRTLVAAAAFENAANGFLVECYKNAAEHQYCMDNFIPFRLIDAESNEMLYLESGASITFYNGDFDDPDVSFSVEHRDSENENTCVWSVTPKNASGNKVQPNCPVKVTLWLPAEWTDQILTIKHIHDDGTIDFISNYIVEGCTISFWVRSFSEFSVSMQEKPHNHEDYIFLLGITPATCTEDGVCVYACFRCGEVFQTGIPAFGHIDEDNDGYCDREGCGEMMTGGDHCPQCGKIHNGGLFDKLTGLFHKIIYRLTHLFG